MNHKSRDLTEGLLWQSILLFALPILAGNLFQNLYNTVDSLIVGNYVGSDALAAVSACAPVSKLLVGFFTGMSTGASVVVSRYFGAKKYEEMRACIHTSLAISILIGITLAGLGIVFAPQILHLMDIPQDVFPVALTYLRIYLAGVLFTVIYNTSAAILRAVGDSRRPLYFLFASSIINIVLDYLFVAVWHSGVEGVAYATILAQLVSNLLVFRVLTGTTEEYKLSLRHLRIERGYLKEIFSLGLPAGVQSSLVSVSNIFVWKYINGFGSAAMAGVGVAQKIDNIFSTSIQAFALAITTFVSQNLGAGKPQRAEKSVQITLRICILLCFLMGVPIYLGAAFFVSLFNREPEVIRYGVDMIHVIVPFYFIMTFNQIYTGTLRGMGNTKLPMIASIFGMVICRQLYLAIALSFSHNIIHIYLCYPLTWAIAASLVYGYYRFGGWREKLLQNEN